MTLRILILTEAEDLHALAVYEALAARGADATLWATSDFPTLAEETIHFDRDLRSSIRIEGPGIALRDPDFDVVWRRRPAYVLDPKQLHPADRAFAEAECSLFRRSILHLVAPRAFWVNPLAGAGRASSKILQHQAAAQVGLRMPETLYTNSPQDVRAFVRSQQGRVIYKPFLPTGWSDGTHQFLPYTASLSDESMVDESIRLTPGIFQELVPKEHEIRLTMIGRRAFGAKVHSQETKTGRLDWRLAPSELRFERADLPESLVERCRGLLDELGLVFGCFDFVVTPDGDYVFLEVNEMGQFLFVERSCGLPLLDAFASFLLQGSPDFEWNEARVVSRYGDPAFDALLLERSKAFASAHVKVPARLVEESRG